MRISFGIRNKQQSDVDDRAYSLVQLRFLSVVLQNVGQECRSSSMRNVL